MASAKSPRVRLQHILAEIDNILAVTHGLTSEQITGDYKNIRTTERAIQIISEAARELPSGIVALEPTIPWKPIIRIGNYLRHEYYRIEPAALTEILSEHLPVLRLAIVRLIGKVPN